MPSVVHELMHVHSLENGRRALLRADEVDRQQQQQPDESRPRQHFAQGQRLSNGNWVDDGLVHGVISVKCPKTKKPRLLRSSGASLPVRAGGA
ncbi:conserved hypothetical protein [Ricinus communis]|uniref:Uncharacterized protein n=1 Tax=Ricinus communis TaxID=3988 RepID=B9T9B4_RICCO|nr:conserved hypothetical protein [Ricinus communis]